VAGGVVWDCAENGCVFAGREACGYCGHPPKADLAAICRCGRCEVARAASAARKAAKGRGR
jgi:hypothetical protein